MRFTFVIPSRDFLASAGARIRYLRMVDLMGESGHQMDLVPIGELAALKKVGEVVVFSKCFDARATVAAAQAHSEGRIVGVDLFDDYFTQVSDSRMILYRTWLGQILRHADFAVCSTERMAEIVASYRPDLPTHVFNDPAVELRIADLPALLNAKLAKARETGRISLCWFGIGDNPFFPVGLEDLTAFGARLAALQGRGWQVELTVSTNARALDADRLASLARLPFPVAVELWTEERETQLLLDSLCCFLPVNAQPFSIAKSLNRAVSALTSGCQVVWAGFPLYQKFDELIYASPEEFGADLDLGNLRLSAERFEVYVQLMNAFASLPNEVTSMLAFVEELSEQLSARQAGQVVRVLLHGVQTNGDAHKAARKGGMLSVASPFSPTTLAYDVVFTGRVSGGDLRMLVTEPVVQQLSDSLAKSVRPFGKINKVPYFTVDWPEGDPLELHDWSKAELPDLLAAYAGIFPALQRRLQIAFGDIDVLISESSKLPFDPACTPAVA